MKDFLQACDDHIIVVMILLCAIGYGIDAIVSVIKKSDKTKN